MHAPRVCILLIAGAWFQCTAAHLQYDSGASDVPGLRATQRHMQGEAGGAVEGKAAQQDHHMSAVGSDKCEARCQGVATGLRGSSRQPNQ